MMKIVKDNLHKKMMKDSGSQSLWRQTTKFQTDIGDLSLNLKTAHLVLSASRRAIEMTNILTVDIYYIDHSRDLY